MPGCTDTAPPEKYTAAQLSRVKDALDALKVMDDALPQVDVPVRKQVWASLPFDLKIEFNYSKWEYIPMNDKNHG